MDMDMDIDIINKFKFRYMVITTGFNYDILKKNFKNLDKPGYRDASFIFDYDEGKILLFSKEAMRQKTFVIKEGDDLSFLESFRTDDESFFYQSDKVKPKTGNNGIDQMYALENIWLAYTYHTGSGKRRMCINSNLFGTFQTIGSREFNLEKLIN